MSDQAGAGFWVLDGVALVAGAAAASVHIRGVIRSDWVGPAWVLVWGSFIWIALTSAGPIVYAVRRYTRRIAGYPAVGDRLWALLGLPWLATALLHTTTVGDPARDDLVTVGLSVGLPIVSLIAVVVVWNTWVKVTPEQAAKVFSGSWTARVGLILAVAWPIQCGVGLVVLG
jgi:hypothetical protein